jgi:hypothetical protein
VDFKALKNFGKRQPRERFKPLLAALGIKVPRGDGFYILRHRNATLMSSFGTPQKIALADARARRWFADTESVYTQVISEDEKRVAA